MAEPSASAVQRALFGVDSPAQVRDWLERHLHEYLGVGLDGVTFEAGAIGAVLGLRLSDGRDVVLKAIRASPAGHDADFARLDAVTTLQSRLAEGGFGCARVLDGPSRTDGVTAVVEERLTSTPSGSPHDPASRAAMAAGLARQIDLLRGVDGTALVAGRPAWANWDDGAWPVPHDPIFDFSTPPGWAWIDAAADRAAAVLQRADRLPAVIGHSDWVWQNVCVQGDRFVAAYDWDSLVFAPESAIVGLVSASFSQGSSDPPDAPTSLEIVEFVTDYERAARRRFDEFEREVAAAAAVWVRGYNARCQLDNETRRALFPPAGSFVEQLEADRRDADRRDADPRAQDRAGEPHADR